MLLEQVDRALNQKRDILSQVHSSQFCSSDGCILIYLVYIYSQK